MDKTILYYSWKKSFWILVCILVVWPVLLFVVLAFAAVGKIVIVIGGPILIGGPFYMIYIVSKMIFHSREDIILTSEGILSNQSRKGRKEGLIPWTQIRTIQFKKDKENDLEIDLSFISKKQRYETIDLSDKEVKGKSKEMREVLMKYFTNYIPGFVVPNVALNIQTPQMMQQSLQGDARRKEALRRAADILEK